MIIKETKIDDIEQIVDILNQISKIHYESRPDIFRKKSKNEIKKEVIEIVNNTERKILIATDENSKIYGLIVYKIKEVKEHINLKNSKVLYIEDIGVDEKYRKKGLGKQLMKKVEEIAKELECRRIELNCWNFNEDAIKFYNQIGLTTQRRIMEKRIGE